jgi:pantothenate kinase
VIVDGNYLLLDMAPWRDLRSLFDLTVLIELEREVLRARLNERWRGAGLPPETVRRKVAENDLPNCDLVLTVSGRPDYRLRGDSLSNA